MLIDGETPIELLSVADYWIANQPKVIAKIESENKVMMNH